MEARKASANHFPLLLRSVFTSQARKRKATNKIPCAQPTIVTAIGCFNKYFNGIAMPSNSKKEIPSAMPVLRSHESFLFILIIYYSSFSFPAFVFLLADDAAGCMAINIHFKRNIIYSRN